MEKITIMAVGDTVLGLPGHNDVFEQVSKSLKKADVAVSQVEMPHTLRPMWCNPEPASSVCADPKNLDAFIDSGFNVVTLGGNHAFDQGEYGITDTIDYLKGIGIATTGAGINIDAARTPAVVTAENGKRITILQYNAVGPRISWAAPMKAGAAFIRVSTMYENDWCTPGGNPTSIYTVCDPGHIKDMQKDIRMAKEKNDVVAVGIHMGKPGDPVVLQYQTEIAEKAIDAGADMVFGHHAHALHGMSKYKEKPIFWCLGDFAEFTNMFDADAPNLAQRTYEPFYNKISTPARDKEFVSKMLNNPARCYTVIAKADIYENGEVKASCIPCLINKGTPRTVTREDGGQNVFDYLENWCKEADLETKFAWNKEGTEIVIL